MELQSRSKMLLYTGSRKAGIVVTVLQDLSPEIFVPGNLPVPTSGPSQVSVIHTRADQVTDEDSHTE